MTTLSGSLPSWLAAQLKVFIPGVLMKRSAFVGILRRVLVVHNPNHNPKFCAAILRHTLARTDQNEFN
jgi:hypothetical protein